MGRKPSTRAASKALKPISPDTTDSTQSSQSLSAGLIKIRPLSALLCDDSNTICSQFSFSENSISNVSMPPSMTTDSSQRQSTTTADDSLSEATSVCHDKKWSESACSSSSQTVDVKERKPTAAVFVTPTKVHRKFRKKLTGNYHKVTDFFSATTPRKSLTPPFDKENVSANERVPLPLTEVEKKEKEEDQEEPAKEVPQYVSSKSTQPVTLFNIHRRLCKTTNLRSVSNRYHTKDQTRMEGFFDNRTDDGDGGGEGCSTHFTTHESSHFPIRIAGLFNVDQVVSLLQQNVQDPQLDIQVEEKEAEEVQSTIMIDLKADVEAQQTPEMLLSEIRRTLLGLDECSVEETRLSQMATTTGGGGEGVESDDLFIIEPMEDDVISISSSVSDQEDPQYMPEQPVVVPIKKPLKRRARKKGEKTKALTKAAAIKKEKKTRAKPMCPSYKIIKDTKFAVDAFRFGNIDGVTHYFLTHFHSDHYIGLKKDFAHPLYMSPVTANLVRKIIKVDDKYIHPIALNSPVMVADVEVTALDANHCPGAVMFLFKLPDGRCMLHVGDFRATADMEMEPVFWNNTICCIYLDTTYLSSKSEHPKQMDSITEMIGSVRQYQEENIGEPYVIIVGTYVIGKERVWSKLATELGCRVWLEKSRLEAVECYGDSAMLELLTVDPTEALIHVLPLQHLFYEHLTKYLEQFEGIYKRALAIRPTGWEKHGRMQRRPPITILGIQYSEHSSYSELERFVRHLRPEEVISTVPVGGGGHTLPTVPAQWLAREVEPKRTGQQSITCFLKVKRREGEKAVKDGKGDEVEGEGEEEGKEGLLDLSMKVHVDEQSITCFLNVNGIEGGKTVMDGEEDELGDGRKREGG